MSTFTIGVFQDAGWARRGVAALLADGFSPENLSVLARDAPEVHQLIDDHILGGAKRFELRVLGTAVGKGSLIAALDGSDRGLESSGIAATIRRVGFQAHDGYIFETLTGRDGVLVAVEEDRRAADALAKLHSYGAGNAAIGAWSGRV